jgi:helix-turn-helix protein
VPEPQAAAGYSQIELAPPTVYGRSTVANVEVGRQSVGRDFWERADGALAATGALTRAYDDLQAAVRCHEWEVAQAREAERAAKLDQWRSARLAQAPVAQCPVLPPVVDDEVEALEPARRVTASDVGAETLGRRS